ncbi:MAG TPA: pentapeptide repeat-containing protein [Pyrinomonadaceae bacterium]|nr:pentapeptide repeat-containing protein [Pyrinomonadaceae bacterium]
MRRAVLVVLAAAGLITLIVVVARVGSSYECDWTGFGRCVEPVPEGSELRRAKTLWDWMELLVVPFVLALGGALLARSEKVRERRLSADREALERSLAEDRQREDALQHYFDRITELLVSGGLKMAPLDPEPGSQGEHTIRINLTARARTLTVLRRLDGSRKGEVIRFLSELHLIRDDNCVIPLDGADLRGAQLAGQLLERTRFSGVNLEGANLRGALLKEANLNSSKLARADLSQAYLGRATMFSADLSMANLDDADLAGCLADGAKFVSASLKGASFRPLITRDEERNVVSKRATLVAADFSTAELDGAVFEGAWLADAKFVGARLARVTCKRSDFTDADFTGASMTDASFEDCPGAGAERSDGGDDAD